MNLLSPNGVTHAPLGRKYTKYDWLLWTTRARVLSECVCFKDSVCACVRALVCACTHVCARARGKQRDVGSGVIGS